MAAANTSGKTSDKASGKTSGKTANAATAAHDDEVRAANPKLAPDAGQSNQIKNPDDWVTGHEPMTGAQASYLKTLSEQKHEPEAFEPGLEKAEASKRINHLKDEAGR